jgi:hypothetical protein
MGLTIDTPVKYTLLVHRCVAGANHLSDRQDSVLTYFCGLVRR